MKNKNEISAIDFFIQVIKDPDRKTIGRIIYEFLVLLFVQKEIPVHYFSRLCFKKEITNFRDYLPNRVIINKIKPHFNDKSVKDVLDNKLFFDIFYSRFNIKIPEILLFNNKKMFVVGNKTILVNNANEFKSLLDEFFSQNPGCDSIFIKKTNSSSSGKNIYKFLKSDLKTNNGMINDLYQEISHSEYLFQETIKQHPDLNILNKSCINTVRIDTFIDKDGVIEVVSAHLRMSINNLCVDNISRGGCFVGINLKTGTLKKYGYSTIQSTGVKILTEHPITKIVFENFKVPFMDQVMELVVTTARYMPGLRLVGWDVAIGESGPVLIEGNYDYDITGNDIADEGYLKNPVFKKALAEIYSL